MCRVFCAFLLEAIETDGCFDSADKTDFVFDCARGFGWYTDSRQSVGDWYLDARFVLEVNVKFQASKYHSLKASGSISDVFLEDLLQWRVIGFHQSMATHQVVLEFF